MIKNPNEEIEILQRETQILFNRVRGSENSIRTLFTMIGADSVSGGTHVEHLEAKIKVLKEERDAFKAESDNQAAAWQEIHKFIPDVPGLSMVGMVRKHVSELRTELDNLKDNNRYQNGYSDGYDAARKHIREMAAKLKP